MRFYALAVTIAAAALAACESQAPQPQQTNVVDATRTDQAFPSQADGNDVFTDSDTGGAPAAGQQGGEQGNQQGPPPQ